MTRDDHLHRVGSVFDEWAATGRGERMEAGHRPTAGRVLDAIPVAEGDRFLDLGTGNGWAARDAAARGASAVGVDVAPRMLRHARAQDANVQYVRAVFEALPFRDGAFDRAFSMEAVYYAKDLPSAVAEMRRVVADGGTVDAVLDYYAENPDSHGWPTLTGVDMHLLAESEWARAFEAAGFGRVTTERVRAPKGVGDAWLHEQGSLHVHASVRHERRRGHTR